MNRFVVVDVETANPSYASICQVGLVTFENGLAIDTWQSLVDPEDYFDPMNVSIHGINERSVRGAPTFPGIADRLHERLAGRIVAHHQPFDRTAFAQAYKQHGLSPIQCEWLDTACVCRRAWPRFAKSGYGLKSVAEWCGIAFKHHDAAEDARATELILQRAISETGLTVEQWLSRSRQPIRASAKWSPKIEAKGNPDGPLAGERFVFTGSLSMPRREAADLAAEAGCDVDKSVTKRTTVLIVGDQDVQRLAGHKKSSNHRKAEELVASGSSIRILCEADFRALIADGTDRFCEMCGRRRAPDARFCGMCGYRFM